MMLGCEIIEAAEGGELILWTKAYALRVLRAHGRGMAEEFCAEIAPSWQDGKIAGATVLLWLGY